MFEKLESFVGVIWSFLLALRSAAQQMGEEPEEFIRFLQTADGKILVPGMVEFVVTARRGKRPGKSLSQQLAEWKLFYWKFFRHQLDVEGVRIPKRQEGFDRLIIVAKGFTLSQIYTVMAQHFDCWRYEDKKDLDQLVPKNARDANRHGSYGIWVRDRKEADEENRNQSAEKRWGTKDPVFKSEMPEMTLAEGMLYEIKFWDETGEHLNMNSWTLYAGSQNAGGRVPCMYCSSGGVEVYWSSPGCFDGNGGSRSAVSSELEASGA